MASTCMSNCINDIDTRIPIRPTYVNLYKWPESDAEFVRSLSSKGRSGRGGGGGGGGSGRPHPRVVDSISCRQMYLRSYTFHRNDQTEEEENEKTKCFGRVKKEKAMESPPRLKKKSKNVAKKKHVGLKRAKDLSCAALLNMFRRLLSCTTKVDVADNHGG